MKLFNKKNKTNKQKGFTLIEMLTVLAIFSILTGITVYNYGRFNNNVIITNLAYEIALAVREAQVFSLGVRAADSDSDLTFETRYGVFFDQVDSSDETTGSRNFVFFADLNKSGSCELDPDDNNSAQCSLEGCAGECQNTKTLTRGIYIKRICVSDSGNPMDDNGNCVGGAVNADNVPVAITFERPNPNAFVKADGVEYKNASILLEAPNGPKRTIFVRNNGQISVDNIDIGQ